MDIKQETSEEAIIRLKEELIKAQEWVELIHKLIRMHYQVIDMDKKIKELEQANLYTLLNHTKKSST